MEENQITVTSPLLPSLDDFLPYLEDIWKRKWITNNGYYHQELEKALCQYLKVPYISLFTNGTLPLICSLQALRITGEVITTPYSFVATTHALWWNGIKPVFVDIDPKTCNIDPNKIEAAITPKTTAIMPVHVYGNPCDFIAIQDIADKYRALYEKASVLVDEKLFNGEYYIQELEDVDAYRYQYGIGCLTDQLLGQFMAQAAGLGYVLPKEHVKKALQSIYKYNFKECMDDVPNVQRTYALNDEAGLVLCSWPKGGRPRFPFAYCDEVWTGVEYQVAVTMIKEGMIEEAFTIIKAIRDRYDGYKRCPWSETEAGHHYIRPMSSYSLIPTLAGYSCDMVNKTMSFAPVINEKDYTTFWINGKGWGTYHQTIDDKGEVKKEVTVLYGNIDDVKVE